MARVGQKAEVRPDKRRNACGGHCLNCSGPLPNRSNPGSPRKFCSPRCRREHWERTHPRIGEGMGVSIARDCADKPRGQERKNEPTWNTGEGYGNET